MMKRDAFEGNVHSLFQGRTPKVFIGRVRRTMEIFPDIAAFQVKNWKKKKITQSNISLHLATTTDWHYDAQWYLITVQQDATYSVYYVSVGSSTYFGCWHPSSRARTSV